MAAALIVLGSGTLLGCPDATVDPDPSPIGLALATVPPGLAPGGEAQLDIVLTRKAGFVGAVTLEWFDQTSDVSAQDVVIPAGQTTGRITFHDLNGQTKLGSHTIHIVGTSAGVRDGFVDFYLTVAVAGTVTVKAFPNGLEAVRGVSIPVTVALTRAAYTQPITLTVTPPPNSGLSATVVQPGTTSTGTVTLAVSPSAPLGDYLVDVTATGANLVAIHYNIGITVSTTTYTLTAGGPTVPLLAGPPLSCGGNTCAFATVIWNPHPVKIGGVPFNTQDVDITGAVAGGVDITITPFTVNQEGGHDVIITVGASVPAGIYQVTMTSRSVGQFDQTATFPVQVVLAPGSFTMGLIAAPLQVVIGTPKAGLLDITRTNFAGPITVTGTGDHAGIAVSALNPVTGAQTVVTVSATAAVPLGPHTIVLTGTGVGYTAQLTFIAFVAAANPIAKIVVGPTPIAMAVGGQPRQLAAQLTDAGGLPTDGAVGWSADVTTIASVDGFGLVTAVGPGTTAITATNAAGTVFGRALVSVAAAAGVARINVAPIHVALTTTPGSNTFAYVATAVDVSGVNFLPALPQSAFLWVSSNTAVATVDNQGGVTAVGTGGAIISATKDGQRGEGAVSVGPVGAVKGSITSTSGQYLSNALATAKLAGTQVAQVTINQYTGQFYLPGLAPGTYQVVISVNGYPSQTLSATVTSGQLVLLSAAVFP